MTLSIPKQYEEDGRFTNNFFVTDDGRVAVCRRYRTVWLLVDEDEDVKLYRSKAGEA